MDFKEWIVKADWAILGFFCLLISFLLFLLIKIFFPDPIGIQVDEYTTGNVGIQICGNSINSKLLICNNSASYSLYNITQSEFDEFIKNCKKGRIVDYEVCLSDPLNLFPKDD